MKKKPQAQAPKNRDGRKRPYGSKAIACGLIIFYLAACATSQYVTLSPPKVPGADFIGSEGCADCHDQMVADFSGAVHARLSADSLGLPGALGCEACHGPGSLHSDDGGEKQTIVNPGRSPAVCLNCHGNVAAQMSLPHAHPVMNGEMACTDCHDPHGGKHDLQFKVGLAFSGTDSKCLECHQTQRGPFMFEHEGVTEGCTNCHSPHGSVNDKMLVSRNANLCLSCHYEIQNPATQLNVGGIDHRNLVNRGTCWSAGCHEAVHGSQVNSHLRY